MTAPLTAEEIEELADSLADVTPGPYGFQSYGRRERLVTMAAATQGGSCESFAIFNRAEDARAFARAVTALPRLLAEVKRAREADPVREALEAATPNEGDIVSWAAMLHARLRDIRQAALAQHGGRS